MMISLVPDKYYYVYTYTIGPEVPERLVEPPGACKVNFASYQHMHVLTACCKKVPISHAPE